MDGWIARLMNGWLDRQIDGWMIIPTISIVNTLDFNKRRNKERKRERERGKTWQQNVFIS